MGAVQLHLRRLQPSESRELRAWIMERHYTKSAPPGYRFALEVILVGERIGGMLLGRPTSRELDPRLWLELNRMVFVDETPHCVESQGLGMMRKHLRTWEPGIRALLSYSDPEQGHEGTVYLADGWAPFGRTKGGSQTWRNRSGRKAQEGPTSRKLRWVRTP